MSFLLAASAIFVGCGLALALAAIVLRYGPEIEHFFDHPFERTRPAESPELTKPISPASPSYTLTATEGDESCGEISLDRTTYLRDNANIWEHIQKIHDIHRRHASQISAINRKLKPAKKKRQQRRATT